ncbi:MAG: cytochrome c-type biogenesis protein CcmH [Rhodospirillaceae bacterium]|jgi:cytochrome c-type biogenesis protein CcmH|nr:cytochrome c-type biogenesis protein CcmH [Rhodospirillaceae bacterium]MBT4218380.1 cytochrome c-type biogenesis protein CcmH [Rhodospirillaceae bacterium]MBT4464278.1 cytochrome c-type biogenesis protein CcmH [Rhodospirillaceae bacterium]MBT5013304.1 cytochrome c-type biogenesis protein CcmH [Rhodospirillaceae bacterium]MBT5308298.1 cytochrome c-type biogenesis protein CcmH [Rhodospirillaceae bacterium]
MRMILLLLAMMLALPAHAVEPSEMLKDPALEARAREASKNLRCVVCQNQSIDESNAELARDMRVLVRERILAGDSNADVIDYMVSRYGDYVLLDPPFKTTTYVLWFGAPLIVGIGILVAVVFYRRRPEEALQTKVAKLSAAEEKRLQKLLEDDEA